jgi:peptide/nickel transport system substrate-binding protein
MLCAELPTIDNGLAVREGDGMAVTIKLKPGLRWGDGVPVTASDLRFTWQLGHDPASGFVNSHSWSLVRSIDVVDDRTAILHLNQVNVHYNEWDAILPAHIEEPIWQSVKGNPAEYIKQTAYNRTPASPGLYNGPYVIAAVQSGVQAVLAPNPYWSGPKPYFKSIVIKLISNTAALQANLLSGDVDMVAGEGIGLTIDQAISLRRQRPDQFAYDFTPSLTYEHINLKIENPILADLRVRQALLYALDRKMLVERLFDGKQLVADSWVNPLDSNFSHDTPHYGYDPGKARALLAEAGWTPGPDGICRNTRGERLSLDFATTSGAQLRERIQQVLQNQWRSVCVEVRINNQDPRKLFGDTLKRRTYSGLVMYASGNIPGGSPRGLHSSQIPTAANGFGGGNSVAFNDPLMDALIEKAESELEPRKRKAIWAEMQTIYAEKLLALPLFHRADPHVFPKWLKGYEPTGHSDPSTLSAEYWYAE